MNYLKMLFVLAVSSRALFAIDLQSATDQQLLNEVGRRMGGGTSGSTAIASYICESAYLKVSLIGETTTGAVSLYLGNAEKCLEQATPLAKYKSRITALTLAAICENAYLKRFGLYPSGLLKEIDSTYLGNLEKCLVQAKQINEG